ncbi:MAG: hypothetical protein HFH67_15810 [Lachnospiraceae bacterium]|nr:hypothetical protein [Lachnospiraceae bacterium]MDE7052832.1 hypothetical protein [Lachnospiraceae bacterium]
MSALNRFLKENKVTKKNEKYAPTKSLLFDDGTPLMWEFKHITSKQDEDIREECTAEVQVKGKPNLFRPKLSTSKYLARLVVESTVIPDLYDASLQDSYGVKTPEDLLYALVDDPGEYMELCRWIQKFQGFDNSFDSEVKEAKN